jgi:hypothetical protein
VDFCAATLVSVGRVAGGENSEFQIAQAKGRDVVRTQQGCRSKDQANAVEAGVGVACEVKQAGLAGLRFCPAFDS